MVPFEQDAAAVEPGAAVAMQFDLAKQQRVAAPQQHQVDDQELAGIAQAVEALCKAHRARRLIAQSDRRQRLQRGLDAGEDGLDGVVGHHGHGIHVRHSVFAAEGGAAALPGRVDSSAVLERILQHGNQLGSSDGVHEAQA
jgi:hypothetical protein